MTFKQVKFSHFSHRKQFNNSLKLGRWRWWSLITNSGGYLNFAVSCFLKLPSEKSWFILNSQVNVDRFSYVFCTSGLFTFKSIFVFFYPTLFGAFAIWYLCQLTVAICVNKSSGYLCQLTVTILLYLSISLQDICVVIQLLFVLISLQKCENNPNLWNSLNRLYLTWLETWKTSTFALSELISLFAIWYLCQQTNTTNTINTPQSPNAHKK